MLTMTIPEEADKVEEPVEIPGTPLSFDNTDTAFFNELSKGFEDLARENRSVTPSNHASGHRRRSRCGGSSIGDVENKTELKGCGDIFEIRLPDIVLSHRLYFLDRFHPTFISFGEIDAAPIEVQHTTCANLDGAAKPNYLSSI